MCIRDSLFIEQMRHTVRGCAVVDKPALFSSLFNPVVVIPVAVENNVFVVFDGLADHFMKRCLKVLCLLCLLYTSRCV